MRIDKIRGIAGEILNVGKNRVWISPEQSQKAVTAMTKQDVLALIEEGAIKKKKENFHSRGRARILSEKKKKGRKRGKGKRRGTKKARMEKKKNWMKNVRAQRQKLKELKLSKPAVKEFGYSKLYRMIKGNYFRGKKYLESFVVETKKREKK